MDQTKRESASAIRYRRGELAREMTEREFRARPELEARYGPAGREKCREDAERHLDYLATALEQDSAELFEDYVAWATVLLSRLQIPGEELEANLAVLAEVLADRLPAGTAAPALELLDSAPATVESVEGAGPSFVEPDALHGALARAYLDALLDADRAEATRLVLDAAEGGVPVRELYLHVFQPVQWEVGRLWQAGEVSVAEEHFITAATQVIMSQLYPRIFSEPRNGLRMVGACVGGDLHEIGMRMVADFFEMDGWDTVYLGANTPTPALVESVQRHAPHVLALSVTMAFHVDRAREVISSVRAVSPTVRILTGGYPFRVDPDLWRKVGADASAGSADGAVEIARSLVTETGDVA